MSPAEKFILPDTLLTVTGPIRIHRNLVHKEHRRAMGDVLHYLFPIHFYPLYFRNATQASCPPNPSESDMPRVMSLFTATLGV